MLFLASILNFKIIEIQITHFKCRMICTHGSVSTVWQSTNVQTKCDFISLVPTQRSKGTDPRLWNYSLPFMPQPRGCFSMLGIMFGCSTCMWGCIRWRAEKFPWRKMRQKLPWPRLHIFL